MGNPTKPSLLISNLFLLSRTGSELHVCELSKAFIGRGWDVTAYALVIGYPTQGILEQLGVTLISYGEEDKLKSSYDLFLAQHHMVSDFLWTNTGIRFKKVVISILGLGGQEALPSFYREASGFIFVSEEARDFSIRAPNLHDMPILVFPNTASRSFFSLPATVEEGSSFPKRIGVISNHIPMEVLGLKELIPPEIEIDYLGFEKESVEVDPNLIQSYDLIISIGRTVQLCFAAQIPCYCYDRFGGPGYLDPDELDVHAYANFSGRSRPRKHSSAELWADISKGYPDAVKSLSKLKVVAQNRWEFDRVFDSVYDFIDGLPVLSRVKDRGASEPVVRWNARMICDLYRGIILRTTGVAQFFWLGSDGNISEDNSCKIRYMYRTWIASSDVCEIPVEETIVRFDPDTRPCSTKIRGGVGQNGSANYRFYDYDPRIISKEIEGDFEFCTSEISNEKSNQVLHQILDSREDEIEAQNKVISDMQDKLGSVRWLAKRLIGELGRRMTRG